MPTPRAHGMLRNFVALPKTGKEQRKPASQSMDLPKTPRDGHARSRRLPPSAPSRSSYSNAMPRSSYATVELLEEDEASVPAGMIVSTPPKKPHTSEDVDDGILSAARNYTEALDENVYEQNSWQTDPLALESNSRKRRSKWGASSLLPSKSMSKAAGSSNKTADHDDLPCGPGPHAERVPTRSVLKEQILLKYENVKWPYHWFQRPTVLFSDGSIAYYEDKAARLLGQEREKIVMTAASSVWSIPSEEGRFTIREGTGRDRVWVFEADDDDERDDWVRHISAHASNSSNGRAPENSSIADQSMTVADGHDSETGRSEPHSARELREKMMASTDDSKVGNLSKFSALQKFEFLDGADQGKETVNLVESSAARFAGGVYTTAEGEKDRKVRLRVRWQDQSTRPSMRRFDSIYDSGNALEDNLGGGSTPGGSTPVAKEVSQKAYRGREYTRSELDDKIHTREDHPKSMSSPFCSAVPRVLSPTFKAPVYEKELHLPNGHNNKFPLPSPQASLPQLCPQPYSARKSSAPSTPFLGEEHTRILMEGVKPMSTSYQYSLETKFDDVLVETNEHAEGICSTTLHSTQSVCRLDESFQVNRQRLSESSSSKAHNHTLESDATTSTNMTCSSCHASCTALSPHKRLFAAVKGTLSRLKSKSCSDDSVGGNDSVMHDTEDGQTWRSHKPSKFDGGAAMQDEKDCQSPVLTFSSRRECLLQDPGQSSPVSTSPSTSTGMLSPLIRDSSPTRHPQVSEQNSLEVVLEALIEFLQERGGSVAVSDMHEFYTIDANISARETVAKVGGLRSLCGKHKHRLQYRGARIFLRNTASSLTASDARSGTNLLPTNDGHPSKTAAAPALSHNASPTESSSNDNFDSSGKGADSAQTQQSHRKSCGHASTPQTFPGQDHTRVPRRETFDTALIISESPAFKFAETSNVLRSSPRGTRSKSSGKIAGQLVTDGRMWEMQMRARRGVKTEADTRGQDEDAEEDSLVPTLITALEASYLSDGVRQDEADEMLSAPPVSGPMALSVASTPTIAEGAGTWT